jgi:hypothetical protein
MLENATDVDRAAWFRQHAYFRNCGMSRRREIWESWCAFRAGEPLGSRGEFWRWLIMIGAVEHGSHFRRIKLR